MFQGDQGNFIPRGGAAADSVDAGGVLYCPPSKVIRALQVPKGFDVADNKIVQMVEPGDLVVTADIPLAVQLGRVGTSAHAVVERRMVGNELFPPQLLSGGKQCE